VRDPTNSVSLPRDANFEFPNWRAITCVVIDRRQAKGGISMKDV
jgi:hypothetical protein